MDRKRLLTVRFSEEDYARIVEKAQLAGRPLSVLVRDALGRVKTWTAQDREVGGFVKTVFCLFLSTLI